MVGMPGRVSMQRARAQEAENAEHTTIVYVVPGSLDCAMAERIPRHMKHWHLNGPPHQRDAIGKRKQGADANWVIHA